MKKILISIAMILFCVTLADAGSEKRVDGKKVETFKRVTSEYIRIEDIGTTDIGTTGQTDAGLRVRNTSTADSSVGATLRGIDCEARISGGEITSINGASITATTHQTINSQADHMYGLLVEAKANGWVTTTIIGQDIRMFRQAMTAPTGDEIGSRIRNANTAGTGIDSALQITSAGTGSADDFDYGIDLSNADIDTADIIFSKGATLSNFTHNSNYSMYLNLNRDVAAGVGDTQDIGWKVRMNTTEDNPTGYVLLGADFEGRVTGGEASLVGGANITGQTHQTVNSQADILYGAKIEAKANGTVNDSIIALRTRNFRQAFTHPTVEYGIYIENANDAESGSGLDAGIYLDSTGTNTTDNAFVIGMDMSSATISTADIRFGNSDILHDSAVDGLVLTPNARGTGDYAGVLHIDDGGDKDTPATGVMTGGAAQKTYGLYMQLNRPNTSAGTGDSEDALIKGVYCNHAVNDSNFIMRGINTHVGNRAGGVCGVIDNQIGSSTRGAYTTLKGLTVVAEDYYGIAAGAEFGGIDVLLKCEGVDPTTTEYGLRIRNLDNSTANSIDDAISISDTGTNTGFTNVINASGATVGQAQIVFSNGAKLFVGSANGENAVYAEVGAYDAAGSIYISSVGKIYTQVANNGAEADWETVTSASVE